MKVLKKVRLIAFLVGLIVLIAIIWILFVNVRAADQEVRAELEPVPFLVEATEIKRVKVFDTAVYIGTISPKNMYTLFSESEGKVSFSAIELGRRVSRGQILLEVNPYVRQSGERIAVQQVTKAKAEYEHSLSQFKRLQVLQKNEHSSVVDVEAARLQMQTAMSQLEIAEQELLIAKRQVQQTKITAPASGVIVEKRVNRSEFVQPGTVLGVLAEDILEVHCWVDGNLVHQLKESLLVDVHINAGRDSVLKGKISRIVPYPNEQKLYAVYVEIPRTSAFSGLSARVVFRPENGKPILLVPRAALVGDFEHPSVYIVDSKKQLMERKVEIGRIFGNVVEVRRGISENEIVVISGQSNVEPGKALRGVKLVQFPIQ